MKTTRLIVFCALFACEISSIRSRDLKSKNSNLFTRSFSLLKPKTSESKSPYQSDDSTPESDTDQDLSDDTTANPKFTRKNSKKEDTVQNEPNFFQKILVRVGGPYCYTKTLSDDLDADVISRRKIKLMYSPQQSDQSLELYSLPQTPRGTIEGEWPYQQNQSRKKIEVRKYIKLNVSLDKQQEDYRLTSKAAERAFISRLYGFINPSENQITDDLIRFIDDREKEAAHLALDLGPDPLADFNSWDDDEKIKFCVKYINNSIVLFSQNMDFDPDGDQIIRKQATVRYKKNLLQIFHDTVHIVICPCVKISTSKDTDDTPLQLGVLPVIYKYEQDFPYAFIYNIWDNDNEEEDKIEVNVRALTKIDVDGLAEDRKKRDRKQQKKREQKEKEKRKARQEAEANENGEGTVQKVLHKIFSIV